MSTDNPALSELIERVERCTGPDREIDRAVHVFVYRRAPISSPEADSSEHLAQSYTSSLDAVVALVHSALPGWTIAGINENDDKSWHAELRKGHLTSYSSVVIAGGQSKFYKGLPTGALALLLAFLRAKESQ